MFRFPTGVSLAHLIVAGGGFLEDKGEIARFKLDGYTPDTKVQANPNLTIDIAVDETPPPCADNDTLGNRILAINKATKGIVRAFERIAGLSS